MRPRKIGKVPEVLYSPRTFYLQNVHPLPTPHPPNTHCQSWRRRTRGCSGWLERTAGPGRCWGAGLTPAPPPLPALRAHWPPSGVGVACRGELRARGPRGRRAQSASRRGGPRARRRRCPGAVLLPGLRAGLQPGPRRRVPSQARPWGRKLRTR